MSLARQFHEAGSLVTIPMGTVLYHDVRESSHVRIVDKKTLAMILACVYYTTDFYWCQILIDDKAWFVLEYKAVGEQARVLKRLVKS